MCKPEIVYYDLYCDPPNSIIKYMTSVNILKLGFFGSKNLIHFGKLNLKQLEFSFYTLISHYIDDRKVIKYFDKYEKY